MTPEQVKILAELAEKLAWKNPDLNVLREGQQYSDLVRILQDHIRSSHKRGRLILPDLSAFGNQTVALFSDYAGEASGDHHSYTFLTCSWNNSGPFIEKMKEVRSENGLGDKEIAFKDFRMGQLRRSLSDYLRLADTLVHGFLLTVVIDKKLDSLFKIQDGNNLRHLTELLEAQGLGVWKAVTAEKLVRVVHIAAFLVGLLAESGQNIFWMTDNDDIAANQTVHMQTLDLFARAMGLYTDEGFEFGHFGGATPFPERDLGHLDLLSLADITASSVEHYLTRRKATGDDDAEVKAGADEVLRWLAHDGLSLYKMTIIIRPKDNGFIESANLEFKLKDPPAGVTYIPIVV